MKYFLRKIKTYITRDFAEHFLEGFRMGAEVDPKFKRDKSRSLTDQDIGPMGLDYLIPCDFGNVRSLSIRLGQFENNTMNVYYSRTLGYRSDNMLDCVDLQCTLRQIARNHGYKVQLQNWGGVADQGISISGSIPCNGKAIHHGKVFGNLDKIISLYFENNKPVDTG